MNKTFSLLFYPKKSKINSSGFVPIYLRITVDGTISEISTKRVVLPEKWNGEGQNANGNTEDIKLLNMHLKALEQKVYTVYHELLRENTSIDSTLIKSKLVGGHKRARMLIPIFSEHNKRMEQLIGKEFAKGTLGRYETCLSHVQSFLKWKYSVTDIDIEKINYVFLNDFEFYLKTEKTCNNNSAVKYLKNFGKIIRICLRNGWISQDPFINYQSKYDEVTRVFLTEEELKVLKLKDLHNERLSQVRDIFLFSCYTGLAYIDTQKLTHNNISLGIDGGKWIITNRQKTKTQSNLPLLSQAERIIEKYKSHPSCVNTGKLLPVLSNQKMNAYLKEIAVLCGIDKDLTYHIARHTFATTVTLSNGVSIESVSKMLGHKNIKTTQHYAKILDKKVSDDMNALRNILDRSESNDMQQNQQLG